MVGERKGEKCCVHVYALVGQSKREVCILDSLFLYVFMCAFVSTYI